MPLYDFRCSCGNTFEALTKPDVPAKCSCGLPAERLPSAPGFVLKGEGFVDRGRPVAAKAK